MEYKIPEATKLRLERLLVQREMLNTAANAVLDTCREVMEVPKDYVISDELDRFVPPPVSKKTEEVPE